MVVVVAAAAVLLLLPRPLLLVLSHYAPENHQRSKSSTPTPQSKVGDHLKQHSCSLGLGFRGLRDKDLNVLGFRASEFRAKGSLSP